MTRPDGGSVPLALVGMSCLFPNSEGRDGYWLTIRQGVDGISDVPETHWAAEDYFDADPSRPDHTYARTGGFLSPIDFNPLDYGMPPKALEATDTSQLLSLVVAKRALEDAGYGANRDYDHSRTSVVLGVTGALELVVPLGARLGHPIWRKALRDSGVAPEVADDVVARIGDGYVDWQEASFPGLLGNVVAGRIANRLDLGGTNCVVDAACASSLSALHLAALELASGRSDMAITGGVDTFNDIFMYMCFSKTPALSPTGHARPFDAKGDGTILGEGVGLVVMKRLADAERDGDTIYAVLKGLGSSSDGSGQAIYAPASSGQARALQKAYEYAEVDPSTVELVEAHGTGTKVGDATELGGLAAVFGAVESERRGWCAVGSVKSQIGHTKAAAGVAGLIKAALALHHKVLPPTIKIRDPQPLISDPDSPFHVNVKPRPWLPRSEHPRRAGVSSFGFGGSNFHCLLEEHQATKLAPDWDGEVQLFTLCGDDEASISAELDRIAGAGARRRRAIAAQSRRSFDPSRALRLLIPTLMDEDSLTRSLASARRLLGSGADGVQASPDGLVLARGELEPARVAVLFAGQGSQKVGMLRDLACQFPELLETLAEGDEAFPATEDGARLSDIIYPPAAFSDAARAAQTRRLTDTRAAQPALGAVGLGGWRLLSERFGLKAEAFGGHSYGELVALCAAGRLSRAELHRLSVLRGRLMAEGEGDRGSMLAVNAPREQVEAKVAEWQLSLVLANHNAPDQAVLSGAEAEIEEARTHFKAAGLRCKKLPVAAAFHSRFVADAESGLAEGLSAVAFPTGAPVYANSTGERYPDGADACRSLLAGQLAREVRFVDQLRNMASSGCSLFLELGPGARLSGLVRATLGDAVTAIALDSSAGGRSGRLDLARALAALLARGCVLALDAWDPGEHGDPDAPDKPRFAISLCGANHRSEKTARPPLRPAPVHESPRPAPTTAASAPAAPAPSPTRPSPESNGRTAVTTTETPMTQPPPRPSPHAGLNGNGRHPHPPAQPSGGAGLPAAGVPGSGLPGSGLPAAGLPAPALQSALQITQQNIGALQLLQQQNAELHRQFLDGQQQAQQNFQLLFAQQQQLLLSSLGVATPAQAAAPVPAPAPGFPTAAVPAPVMPTPAPVMRAPAAPVAPAPAPAASPARAPAVMSAPSSPAADLAPVLLEVVADKTGYPAEMLEPGMSLDADLGIDSIKRVEILSALQDRVAGLPSVQSEDMSRIQTLQDILDQLAVSSPATAAPVTASSRNGASKSAPPVPTNGNLQRVLLEVVADKTGYPVEMLEPGMSLDADLGIDSIKRVEILSALQDRVPGLPSVQSEDMSRIQTLQDILDQLDRGVSAPAPVAAAPSVGAEADLETVLLEVVADKTGYPVEMLEPGMSLDADLGIDSIKRVEILSALQDRVPGLPSVQSEDMSRIQTLQDILAVLAVSTGGGAEPRPFSEAPAGPTETGAAPKLNDPNLRAAALAGDQAAPLEVLRPVLLSFDLAGAPARSFSETPAARVAGPPGEALDQLVAAIAARGFRASRAPLGEPVTTPDALDLLVVVAPPKTDRAALTELFLQVRECREALQRSHGRLAAIVELDGGFGLEPGPSCVIENPLSRGLAGLVKTAALEWPEIDVRVLDAVAASRRPDHLAQALLCEGPAELGLVGDDGESVRRISLAPQLEPGSEPIALEAIDTILVTGGAKGVTAAVVRELAAAGPAHFVLLGRSPAPGIEEPWLVGVEDDATIKRRLMEQAGLRSPRELGAAARRIRGAREIRATLAAIQSAGASVEYRSCDVRDRDGLLALVDDVEAARGPISGLIHGAGVLADRLIADKTAEDLNFVLGTKLDALPTLLERLTGLRLVLMFSSSTARFGRRGQSDYAMANEALNGLVARAISRRKGLRAISACWGPWAGGMVDAGLAELFRKEGVELIPIGQGARRIARELAGFEASELVLLGHGSTYTTTHLDGPIPAEPTPSSTTAPDPELTLVDTRPLSVADIPVLRSHVINGRAVVPMALMVEWLAHGALHGQPGLIFTGLDDLTVLSGIKLEDASKAALAIYAGELEHDSRGFSVAVELRSEGLRALPTLHARARVRLAESLAAPEDNALELPRGGPGPEPKDIYQRILFHGPELEAIDAIERCSADGLTATVRTAPRPTDWMTEPARRDWIADPLVLDAAFQAMIVWAVETTGVPSLPTGLGRYEQFCERLPEGALQLVIRVTETRDHAARADIDILGTAGEQAGRLLARIKRYDCVMDSSLAGAFARRELVSEGSRRA